MGRRGSGEGVEGVAVGSVEGGVAGSGKDLGGGDDGGEWRVGGVGGRREGERGSRMGGGEGEGGVVVDAVGRGSSIVLLLAVPAPTGLVPLPRRTASDHIRCPSASPRSLRSIKLSTISSLSASSTISCTSTALRNLSSSASPSTGRKVAAAHSGTISSCCNLIASTSLSAAKRARWSKRGLSASASCCACANACSAGEPGRAGGVGKRRGASWERAMEVEMKNWRRRAMCS